jgi:predicted RecA/RadA family phage recombinase
MSGNQIIMNSCCIAAYIATFYNSSDQEQNMNNARKSNPGAAKAAGQNEVVETFIPLYTKNVERLAELQKKSLDIAVEQNAELIGACKKAFSFFPEAPGAFVFDLMGQSFERFVETEKGAIDLAVGQSQAVAVLAKERGASAAKIAEGVTALLKQSVEYTVAAQKKALDNYSEQHKAACETAKKQFRIANNPAAEAFQTGIDALIETQKTMLDLVTKPFTSFVAA